MRLFPHWLDLDAADSYEKRCFEPTIVSKYKFSSLKEMNHCLYLLRVLQNGVALSPHWAVTNGLRLHKWHFCSRQITTYLELSHWTTIKLHTLHEEYSLVFISLS